MHEQDLGGLAGELAARLPKTARVLQLEVERGNLLPWLKGSGFENLYGASRLSQVYDLPDYTSIRYMRTWATRTHLPQSFVDCCVLTRSPSRAEVGDILEILRPEGLAVLPEAGAGAAESGFERAGSIGGKMVLLEKTVGAEPHSGDVSILSYSDSGGGIGEYARLLEERFREAGVRAEIVRGPESATADDVLVEYANGLAGGKRLVQDVRELVVKGRRVLVEVHDTLERFSKEDRRHLQEQALLLYRANEAAERDAVKRYVVVPHASYATLPILGPREAGGTAIGSFGFAARYKRYPLIARAARRLGVPLRLMVSVNGEVSPARTAESLSELGNELGVPIRGAGSYSSAGVEARVGFFTPAEIEEEMGRCSHVVFAHTTSGFHQSGVMTMAKRFARPIVALDSFQARQAQVLRVDSFTRGQGISDATRAFGASLLHRKVELGKYLGRLKGVLTGRRLDSSFLEGHSELSRDEDGFEYLRAVLRFPT